MKTMKKLALLLLAVAAGGSAMAQEVLVLTPNKSYSFSNDTAAGGAGSISYQWYRNGQPIVGATSTDYILPANLAHGVDVEFKRAAMSNTCPGEVTFSNIFYISFCGVLINSVCWASENVVAANMFASRPDEYTPFFQWNRTKAWPATGFTASGWNSVGDDSFTWTANPCPIGWRLPTQGNFSELCDSGSTWAAADSARGAAVVGKFFGPNHATCSLPNNMAGCIFLPALGHRLPSNGELYGGLGYYWSRTQYTNTNGLVLFFHSSGSFPSGNNDKAEGMALRCVYDY